VVVVDECGFGGWDVGDAEGEVFDAHVYAQDSLRMRSVFFLFVCIGFSRVTA